MEAQFVASVLRGSKVSGIVLDDNICRFCPWAMLLVGGAKVVVGAVDVKRSLEVLAGVESGVTNIRAVPLPPAE